MNGAKPVFWRLILYSLVYYILTMLVLFISAGSIYYLEGWIYSIALIIISTILSFYFLISDPELIARRLQPEEDKTQKWIRAILTLLYMAMYVIAGMDFRHQWSNLPYWLEIFAIGIFIAGYIIIFFVFKENSYTASNIKAYKNQKVIDTGLYALIRHPMYSGAFLIILSTPVILGSWWALIPSILTCGIIVIRAKEEEKILSRDLKGYEDYLKKVKDRFIPGVV